MQKALGLTARCKNEAAPGWRGSEGPSSPRPPHTPRSPGAITTCCAARVAHHRRGAVPHVAAPPLAAEPASPRTPLSGAPAAGGRAANFIRSSVDFIRSGLNGRAEETSPKPKPMYDCVDVVTQYLAVNLTLEEYKHSLLAAGGRISSQLPVASVPLDEAAPTSAGGCGAGAAGLSSNVLTSSDFESMQLCSHCRYPCYLSGMPACEASDYLQMWDADSHLKPRNFDAKHHLTLRGVADIAAVSAGGRANGRWKPDNQDSFLLQPTPAASSDGADSAAAPAAAIGVFDGHGRLGGVAAQVVKQAMSERLAAMQGELVVAAAGGVQGAARLLDSCFNAAEAAMGTSGRDFSKSGCTAVLALLGRDSVSVAWAGDSRAVFGICDPSASSFPGGVMASGGGSGGEGSSFSGAVAGSYVSGDSYDGGYRPLCAAVPLTEDHKPDKPAEHERILSMGGRVTRLATDRFGNPAGPFRVFLPNNWSPGLALSRSFGDTLAGTIGVTAKPEVTVLPLPTPTAPTPTPLAVDGGISNGSSCSCCSSIDGGSSSSSDAPRTRHVLIVASDGLWEWISNSTAVGIASVAASADDAAHALVEAAQKQWAVRYRGRNCDDITVVCAFFDR